MKKNNNKNVTKRYKLLQNWQQKKLFTVQLYRNKNFHHMTPQCIYSNRGEGEGLTTA